MTQTTSNIVVDMFATTHKNSSSDIGRLPRATLPTTTRIAAAWSAVAPRRRRQVVAGTVIGLAVTTASASVLPGIAVVALGIVSTLAALAALVDLHEERIPNRLMATAMVAIAAAAFVGGWRTVADVTIGLLVAALPLFIVRYGKGLGIGDVKFAAVLGAAGGLLHPFAGLGLVWFAALASGLYALARDRQRLVLGPWLWAGFVTACAVSVIVVQAGGQSWPARP